MGISCRGICIDYKHSTIHNGMKYSSGLKRCTECQIFMDVQSLRCPCCRTKLRTRARNKKTIH